VRFICVLCGTGIYGLRLHYLKHKLGNFCLHSVVLYRLSHVNPLKCPSYHTDNTPERSLFDISIFPSPPYCRSLSSSLGYCKCVLEGKPPTTGGKYRGRGFMAEDRHLPWHLPQPRSDDQ
jgi:hypothetical protein